MSTANNFAFIDGQNLNAGVKALGWKLDHKKFRNYLKEQHSVVKAYLFIGYMEEHQDLYNALQEAGFILVFKPLVRYNDGTIKGNIDADMVLQVMIDIENYDKALIVSGDGDFAGLIRHLISNKKLAGVLIPNKENYSSLFDRLDDRQRKNFHFMNDLKGKLSYGNVRRPSRARKAPSAKPKQ